MDKAEALRIIDESLARPYPTPYVGPNDPDTYLEALKARLRSLVIDPVSVTAVASDYAQKWLNQPNTVRSMVALARSESSWLLYDEHAQVFAQAHGSDHTAGPLSLLGFESDDALGAWLA